MTDAAFLRVLRRQFDEYDAGLRKALGGLTVEERRFRPQDDVNHIDFLVWHMARNEDGTISACARTAEAWTADGWFRRWRLPPDADGCGFTTAEVGAFPAVDIDELLQYLDSVRARTDSFLDQLTSSTLDDLVWAERPDVTVGQLVAHLVVEQSQHLGQVALLRGLQRGQEHTTSWNNPETPAPA